jgi:hypothetical protein
MPLIKKYDEKMTLLLMYCFKIVQGKIGFFIYAGTCPKRAVLSTPITYFEHRVIRDESHIKYSLKKY